MIIEIGYSYQFDKTSPVQTSWTYFYVKGDDLTKAKTKAKTYWKKFVSDYGWVKKVKLTHIEVIPNDKSYTPDFIVVSSAELPAPRKRRSPLPKSQTSSRKPSTSRSPRSKKSVRAKT
jgi:hypothetical protein